MAGLQAWRGTPTSMTPRSRGWSAIAALIAAHRSERGHVGPGVAAALAVAAAVVAALGIHGGSDTLGIIGVALFGAAIVVGTQVPHLWLRKLYRRIDRITDESDPDKHVGRPRIEL